MWVASKIPLHATYAQPVHSVAQVRKKAYPCLSVFCKTFFRKLQDVFPKVARRFSKSCNSIFLKVANSIFPMLIVTSFPPSAFKIDPTLASDSAVVSSYQLPPCSAGAAPGWLLITASCTNPWEADVLRI